MISNQLNFMMHVLDTKVNLRKNENMGVPTFILSFTLTDIMRNYT